MLLHVPLFPVAFAAMEAGRVEARPSDHFTGARTSSFSSRPQNVL
jgi:hypothetical protein